ncbi:MAG: DUF4178 domain-containing protein [Candidatus Wallbacteria bacterium]|nr:DUF4178 domain-containing protein [Candidatus Wallbacteria bacterium]
MTGSPGQTDSPKTEGLKCTACGAPIELRAANVTERVACAYCGSVLDAKHPQLAIIQKLDRQVRYQPIIPLGRRGQIRGETMECIGMQRRRVTVEGVNYEWSEYLLWNPYKGFRFLAECNGHWSYIKITNHVPKLLPGSGQQELEYMGKRYRHFQTATATTVLVVGEFNWQVVVGETARVSDFVHPPLVVSREVTGNEITWAVGEYASPETVWQAFKLAGSPRESIGVAPTQPWAHETKYSARMRLWPLFLAVAFAIHAFFWSFVDASKLVKTWRFTVSPQDVEKTRLTESFELDGRTSDVEVRLSTNLSNNWAYFNMALVNESTNVAYDFGREVSYYYGSDSDGSWSEGGQSDECYLPSVPAGRYFLLVETEPANVNVAFDVSIWRDVPMHRHLIFAVMLLSVPGLWLWWRRRSFEYNRWLESDHPMEPLVKFGGESDDDD